MSEGDTADGSVSVDPSTEDDRDTDSHETSTSTEGDAEQSLVDELTEQLEEEGVDIYHGREFVSIRSDGQLAPNSTVTERYFGGKEAVMLGYEPDANQIVIVPLDSEVSAKHVWSLQNNGDRATISASRYLKQNDIEVDETVRYKPEWNEDKTGDGQPGALLIDLDQDGEVAQSGDDSDTEA